MSEIKNQFLNSAAAKQLIASTENDSHKEILWRAFHVLTLEMAPVELDGQFDVLFFVRVLNKLMEDRTEIGELMLGHRSVDDEI